MDIALHTSLSPKFRKLGSEIVNTLRVTPFALHFCRVANNETLAILALSLEKISCEE